MARTTNKNEEQNQAWNWTIDYTQEQIKTKI